VSRLQTTEAKRQIDRTPRVRHPPSVVSNPNTAYPALLPVSQGYSREKGTFPRVTHPSAARAEALARLACVKPAASVRSEPGSNSQVETSLLRATASLLERRIAQDPSLTDEPLHIAPALIEPELKRHRSPCIVPLSGSRWPTNGEADTHIIGRSLMGRYANVRPSKWTKPPAYPFIISKLSKSPGQTSNPSRPTVSATSCPSP
jgi:hypothetical protein